MKENIRKYSNIKRNQNQEYQVKTVKHSETFTIDMYVSDD